MGQGEGILRRVGNVRPYREKWFVLLLVLSLRPLWTGNVFRFIVFLSETIPEPP